MYNPGDVLALFATLPIMSMKYIVIVLKRYQNHQGSDHYTVYVSWADPGSYSAVGETCGGVSLNEHASVVLGNISRPE